MKDIPRSALLLGLAGLIPFYAPLLPAVRGWLPLDAFLAYAVVIAGFMAGVQWGMGVATNTPRGWAVYGVSVLPALWAVLAFIVPRNQASEVLVVAFLAILASDWWHVQAGRLPRWYWRLRILLTAFVVLALLGWAFLLAA
ncbi:MAG: DUF3429 domain-containing protein [Gammaproteobacteria bacterium]|nr:DUF3429 domain-containing protein [Gammaproteobacteria bacterium]